MSYQDIAYHWKKSVARYKDHGIGYRRFDLNLNYLIKIFKLTILNLRNMQIQVKIHRRIQFKFKYLLTLRTDHSLTVIQNYLYNERIKPPPPSIELCLSKSWTCYLYKTCMSKLLSDQKKKPTNPHVLIKKHLKRQDLTSRKNIKKLVILVQSVTQ